MYKVNEASEFKLLLLDSDGIAATGKTVTSILYDETDTQFSTPTVTEIGSTGIYNCSFTPDAVGEWTLLFNCTDPIVHRAITIHVGKGIEADLLTEINANETKIDTVDTVVDGIQTDLSNASDGLGALKTEIDANETKIDTVDTVVDGIQTDLSNASDGLGALKTEINANETKIDTVDTVVDGIQTDLSNASDGLGALKTEIDANETKIDAIQTDLDNASDGLGALKTEIDANETKIDALPNDADIGDLPWNELISGHTTNATTGYYLYTIGGVVSHAEHGNAALKIEIDANETKIDAIPTTHYFEQTCALEVNHSVVLNNTQTTKYVVANNDRKIDGLISTTNAHLQRAVLVIYGVVVNTYDGNNYLDCTTAAHNQWQINLDNGAWSDLDNQDKLDGQMVDLDWWCEIDGASTSFALMFDITSQISSNVDGNVGVRLENARSKQISLKITWNAVVKLLWKL